MPWSIFVFLVFFVAMPWSILRLLRLLWLPEDRARAKSNRRARPAAALAKHEAANNDRGHHSGQIGN